MNCGKARKSISDYLDGRLSGNLLSEFELHVRGCTECAGELDEMRRMVASLRSLAVSRVPVDLWPQVREGICTGPAPAFNVFSRPVFLIPAAAAAAFAAGLLLSLLPKPASEVPAKLTASEYRHYVTEHVRFQERSFVDPDVAFIATELDRANTRSNGE